MIRLKPEQSLQITVCDYIKLKYPHVWEVTFAISHEKKITIAHGALLGRMGRKSGISDLFIAYPNDIYHGLWIELKSKGKKPTESQVAFMKLMNKQDYYAFWSDNFDEISAEIDEYVKDGC